MIRKYFFFFILLFLTNLLNSQISALGYPIIKNYSHEEYNGGPQIWEVEQDANGVMYFGNVDGVLEFDGANWKTYKTANKTTVKELFVDDDNRLFVGAKNDFGYLDIDENGSKIYKSLTPLIGQEIDFEEILGIGKSNNKIYFVSMFHVFIYDYDTIKTIEADFENRMTYQIDNELFSFSRRMGVLKMDFDTVFTIEGSEIFNDIGVIKIEKISNEKYLFYSLADGIYDYDLSTGNFSKITSNFPSIQKNHIFDIERFKNYFVIATYYGGLIFTDENFDIIRQINESTGLANDVVTEIFVDKAHNIWCATQNGITFIETSTPIVLLDQRVGLPKIQTAAYFSAKYMYIGSVTGLYYSNVKNNYGKFQQVNEIKNQVWDIKKIKNSIYFCDYNGINYLDSNYTESISDIGGTNWYVQKYSAKDNLYIVGTNLGVVFLELVDNKLQYKSSVMGFQSSTRWFGSDKQGNLWLSDQTAGIFKLTLNDELTQVVDTVLYDTTKGLPTNIKNYLWQFEDVLFVGTEAGIYFYNKDTDMFEPYKGLEYLKNFDIWKLDFDSEGNLWYLGNKAFGKMQKQNKKFTPKLQPFNRFDASIVVHFHVHNADTVLFCMPNHSLLFFPKKKANYSHKFSTLIRSVEVLSSKDSNNMIFGGNSYDGKKYTTHTLGKPKIKYKNNDLKFRFSCPYFIEAEKNMFAYYLEGYDDEWSEWSNLSFRDYTNLKEGNYIFHVKSKNIYGLESQEASFNFKIMAPWYRTIFAYILYGVLGIFLIWLILKFYTRRLERQKIKLEYIVRERTEEILQQKEEIQAQAETLEDYAKKLEKLSIVASETDNAVMIMDADANFEWVNEGFTKLYGFSFEEFTKLHKNAITASSNPEIKELIKKSISEKRSISYQSEMTSKSGKIIWVQTTITPILGHSGKVEKVIAIDSDIRKLKKAEQKISAQNEELTFKNQQITDSISYAQTIQNAILPLQENLDKHFENFVLFRPKDIVSGDFYWFIEFDNYLFIADIDCTGHGVPGAFMSMIGNTLLNQIVTGKKKINTAEIMTSLDKMIVRALKQDKTDNDDGMDVCMVRIDKEKTELQFTGAKRDLFYYKKSEDKILRLKSDRKSIGGTVKKRVDVEFTAHNISIEKDEVYYLFSDGYIDQNNAQRKKFGTVQLLKIFDEIATKPMYEQKEILENKLDEWMQNTKQRDDISMIGIRV